MNLFDRSVIKNEGIEVKTLDNGTFHELLEIFKISSFIETISIRDCMEYMLDSYQFIRSDKIAQITEYHLFPTRKTEVGAEQKDKTIDISIPTDKDETLDKLINLYPDIPLSLLKPKSYIMDFEGLHYRFYFNDNEDNPFNHDIYINGNNYLLAKFKNRIYLNQMSLFQNS
jgi:hypothetical protein